MGFLAGRWTGTQRRGLTLIVAAITAVLMMAIAAPAQAAPNTAKAWGRNAEGQLGDGTTTGPGHCEFGGACSTVPAAVSKLSGVTALAGSEDHSLALLSDGTVMAWGANFEGQLGDGSTTNSDVPVAVTGLSEKVTAIAAGSDFSLALLEGGTVMAWGGNGSGQLGDGTTTSKKVPVAVLKEVTAIAAGRSHSLAVLSNGEVRDWGNGGSGQLGNGRETFSDVPVPVCSASVGCLGRLSGVTAVAGGEEHSLALLSSGEVMGWGYNGQGQLGNGTETSSDLPVAVTGLKEVTAIAAGRSSYALVKNGEGEVRDWGENDNGELGDGTFTGPEQCGTFKIGCSKIPIAVPGLKQVTAIAGNGLHALALLKDRTVKAWGASESGELGNGTSAGPGHCLFRFCSTTPVAVCAEGLEVPCPTGPYLGGVAGIAAGWEHSLAFGPPPAVTNVNPSHGSPAGGTEVTITGTDFTGASAVKFGSTSAASFTVNSATSITAVSPAGTGVVDVTVTNTWGTSATGSADQFSYEPPPTVTRLEPNHGPAAGGTSVTITGTNLTGANAVKFGSTNAASLKVNSDTSITAVSPAGTGTVHVTVTTPSGTSATSSADQFTYGPTVTKVEPNHGSPSGGTTVTITGTGFTGTTAVKFGASNGASFKVSSPTSITAVSPKAMGALTVDVTVTTPAGTSPTSSADRFTYMKK
jgi:alpha-tubulin suppressor-like RCC1 family protein